MKMLILTGNNLGERHQNLNAKVTEAVHKKANFDEVKANKEKCDVDKLFKIELASRYRNIDYILEVLKSGDAFHIARALKCIWIYNDEYSNYINVTYLENNIFSNMSKKMRKKMLTSISMNLRNGERAIDFYNYCKGAKMTEYAFKFLVFTTDKFKLSLMKSRYNFDPFRESKYLKEFIGKSMALARCYLSLYNYDKSVVYQLRYLYTVSDEEGYLDSLQIYYKIDVSCPDSKQRFGVRISKDILKKRKNRVLENPIVYINLLNKKMLIKYLTSEDVKCLAPGLLPPSSKDFWFLNFYQFYNFLFEKIPKNELFAYLKKIFNSKYYSGESFEMYIEFYKLGYYEMLTNDEKEEWALLHIEHDKDLPEIENFMWYKFVSFSKAFSGIKRYIFLTSDKDKRSQIVNILPHTIRNQDDLANILDYYCQWHVNEKEEHKESFINEIIMHHDIYSFNDECWTLLDKLFYSLEVYSTETLVSQQYREISMIYHILHNKELPEAIQEYIKDYNPLPLPLAIYRLSKERKAVFFNYLSKCHSVEYDIDFNEEDSATYKPSEEDVRYNLDIYESQEEFKPKFVKKTEGDFLRWLKRDKLMATEGISDIRSNTKRYNFRLCRLFRKLKVYFPNDVGKEYLQYFVQYLSDVPKGFREYRHIKMAVVGVFYLADEDFKEKFVQKYVPETPKIDHMEIDRFFLQVQKAMCRLLHHSRPYLPLPTILKFIVGDYVHYCLPMINHYLANWVCVKDLTKALLDAPVSIQKHGLRLAFNCYSQENLKLLTIDTWKKTRNVSVRKILYQTLFNRMLIENEKDQKELYEVLKLYTAELNHDDADEVYSLLVSEALPYQFRGDFIETAWLSVSKLPDKALDLKRKTSLINHIDRNIIYYVQRQFIRLQIIDDHIHDMLFMKNIKRHYDTRELQDLIDAKWSLTAKYIVTFDHGKQRLNKIEQERSLEVLRTIMTKSMELWNYIDGNTYVMRKFIQDFIKMVIEKDPMTKERYGYMIPVYRCILNVLQQSLNKEEIYLISWELKLHMICRKLLHSGPYLPVKDICNVFGKKVGNLVKELVEKDEFYHCFYESMASIVNDIGTIICDDYGEAHTGYFYYVSESLTDIKMVETHVIAIMMLPTDEYVNWTEEHGKAIRKIRKYDNVQIRSFLYEKYVASDNCVRGYLYV